MSAYLFLHFAEGADLSGLEVFAEDSDLAAAKRAKRLLRAARETRRIEVWRNGALLFAMASA